MNCPASITAALSAALPCGAAPAARRWVLADRVSESRCVPGMLIQANLQAVPARDSLGRIAHVRGILVNAWGLFGRANGSVEVRAMQLRSLFSAMVLQDVTGHTYWPSIDARDVIDDTFFRHGAHIGFPTFQAGKQAQNPASGYAMGTTPVIDVDYGIPANAGAADTYIAPIGFYAPLTTLGGNGNPLAGLIPLAALQSQSGQGAFRFRLNTTLPQVGADPATGVTFTAPKNGQGQTGLDIWLDVIYLPALAVGPTWTLESYTLPDASGILRRPEATTEHAHIRYYPEDIPGSASGPGYPSCSTIDNITMTTAGFTDMPGMSKQDVDFRTHLGLIERDSAQTRMNAAQDLPMIANGLIQTLAIVPFRPRGLGSVKGAVQYKFSDAGGNTFFRFNQRSVNCNERDHIAAMMQSTQCQSTAQAVMTDAKGNPGQGEENGVMLVLDPRALNK